MKANHKISLGLIDLDSMVVSFPVTDLTQKQMNGVNPLNGGHTQTFIFVVK